MPKTFMQIASEAMAHVPSRLIRWAGLAAILGAAIWWTSWILNSFTKDGSVAVLGLSERGWRTVANSALLSFTGGLAGITAAHASRAGKLAIVGFLTTLLGLVVMLAGNVIEFWVAKYPGGFMFLFGLLVQPIGLILLGIHFQGERTAPLGPAHPARFRRDSGTNGCRSNGPNVHGHPCPGETRNGHDHDNWSWLDGARLRALVGVVCEKGDTESTCGLTSA